MTRHGQVVATSNNMQYNGGPVMLTSQTYAIFWEPAKLQDGTATHVSARCNSLIQRYFGDVGGSGLYNNNMQYYQTTSGAQQNIQDSSTFGAAYVDTTAYPAPDCVDLNTPGDCISDAAIQAEVSKVMASQGWTGGLTHMFFVFTSYGEGSCMTTVAECAFTLYCAYHGYYTNASGQAVIYASMPYAGTDPSGCGAPTSPNSDADADSTINVTSHEHMEAVTDPELNAWYDTNGNEIGDKCAWNFGTLGYDNGLANQSWNGHYYIVQQEWDNAQSGCVQTGP